MNRLVVFGAIVAWTMTTLGGTVLRPHPRLFVSGPEDFAAFNARAEKDPQWTGYRKLLLADADRVLALTNVVPEKTGFRLLGPCWEVTYRLTSLATAYRLTGDERYLKRAKDEMLAACAWPTWNPSHYLDVASIQIGLATAYDWLYDALTSEERATVSKAIVRLGWDEAETTTRCWWKTVNSNWQGWSWCGVVMAALAIYEDVPERADAYLAEAMEKLPISLKEMEPDGVYPEGVSYWGAGVGMPVLLMASIESATGKTCPLSDLPGIRATGAFAFHMYDPQGKSFNFSDCGVGSRNLSPTLFWLAKRAGHPEWLYFARKMLSERPWERRDGRKAGSIRSFGTIPFLLPLWAADLPSWRESEPCAMPLDWCGQGPNPVATLRTSWTDPLGAFVAVKGGRASINHGHMDVGAFIYTAKGVRWAVDCGAQDYHSIEKLGMGLWDGRQTGDRWKVFRLSEKAHNVISVDNQPQDVKGLGRIVQTSFGEEKSSVALDLTEVFGGQAKNVERRLTLDKRTGALLIDDRLSGLRPGAKAEWKILNHVDDAEISGSTAVLRAGAHHLRVTCTSAAEGIERKFDDLSAPVNTWDSPNKGLKRLSLVRQASNDGIVDFSIQLTPMD